MAHPLGFAPVRSICGVAAAAWVTGVLAAPGTQGELAARAAGNIMFQKGMPTSIGQHAPVFSPGEPPLLDTEAWQATVYRVAKSWT